MIISIKGFLPLGQTVHLLEFYTVDDLNYVVVA